MKKIILSLLIAFTAAASVANNTKLDSTPDSPIKPEYGYLHVFTPTQSFEDIDGEITVYKGFSIFKKGERLKSVPASFYPPLIPLEPGDYQLEITQSQRLDVSLERGKITTVAR